jgi:hypothetical protein
VLADFGLDLRFLAARGGTKNLHARCQEDLDKTIITIAEAIKKREKLARAKVPEVPLLPEKNGEVEKAAEENS